MTQYKVKTVMECLWRGDPRVCLLLGKQKRPPQEMKIRKSQFVYSLYEDGRYLLFHTLTKQLIAVAPHLIGFFLFCRLFPLSTLEEEALSKLYEDYFLVPEGTQESQLYLEIKDILVLKEELPKGITHYVILPTTVCNARCFYCFEQGMRYQNMSPETEEDTLRFILRHKPVDSKVVHIHWFGGEPLCATKTIDRISSGLKAAGIEYVVEMTSNGSLFTDELIKKARESWKLVDIQITLDGMAEEYALRKRYISSMKNPFNTVIRNIHRLTAAGINVTVRLNVDENNISDIYRVVDYLKEEFSEEERKQLKVYAHSLFGEMGDGLNACPIDTGTEALEARVLEINDYILSQELMPFDLGTLFSLKSHYCMVTAPECNVLIDSSGQLFACDAMPDYMRYGTVKTDIDPEAWKRVTAPCSIGGDCEQCVFLPQCTEFSRCPSRIAYDSCFRLEKMKLDRELVRVYELHRKAQRQQQKEAEDSENKGASHVSN